MIADSNNMMVPVNTDDFEREPETDTLEFSVLLEQAKSGDPDARCTLLEVCRPLLKELALAAFPKQLAADWDPSDLVQESLFEMHRDLPDFRGSGSKELLAWLRSMIDHNLIDRMRYANSRKRFSSSRESLERTHVDGLPLKELVACRELAASRIFDIRDQFHQLIRQIANLPNRQSEVVAMRYLRSMTLEEIAEATGNTESAVAGLIFRGIQSIRQAFVLSD